MVGTTKWCDIDGGVPENAPIIANSIRKLGYRPEDIAILLNTHAHVDHSGGLAELKALNGAELIASEGDRSALEGGFLLGSEDRLDFQAPPVGVDRIIEDGETLSLGGVSLSAYLTPGHTRGCTSWKLSVTEADRTYNVLVFCSASVSVNRLVNPPQYPGIVEDYRRTFKSVADWRPATGRQSLFFHPADLLLSVAICRRTIQLHPSDLRPKEGTRGALNTLAACPKGASYGHSIYWDSPRLV